MPFGFSLYKDAGLSKIKEIQTLVRYGLYYLTEHANDEAMTDDFDIYDIENGLLTGRIRKTWPKDLDSCEF
jgi:hypothetical protein